jgi:hypothetical protein
MSFFNGFLLLADDRQWSAGNCTWCGAAYSGTAVAAIVIQVGQTYPTWPVVTLPSGRRPARGGMCNCGIGVGENDRVAFPLRRESSKPEQRLCV